jgi:c-di-GMP-binding flagellar brake protein YcgR
MIEKEVTERSAFGDRKKRIKQPPTPFEEMDIAGKIVIAFYNLDTKRFAHGVRFQHLPQRTEDEIQRFIHLYQLKQLRERAEREAFQL